MDHTTCWAIISAEGLAIAAMAVYIKYLVKSHLRDLREINGMSGGNHGDEE